MKIAKKVLALVMAIAVIGCSAAMAFAAEATPEVVLDTTWEIDEYDCITLRINFKNAAGDVDGLKAWSLTVDYDKSIFNFDSFVEGADAEQVGNSKNNSFATEVNGNDDGTIVIGGYFKECLWTAEKFAGDAKRGATCVVNADDFNAYEIYLIVEDAAALKAGTAIEVKGTFDTTEVAGNVTNVVEEPSTAAPEETTAAPEETTAAPEETTAAPEETTTEEAPSTPEETTAKGETDKGPATGDTGVLAIAAGVVALAGAAFVVSKKRK